jgi:hypothetical protein
VSRDEVGNRTASGEVTVVPRYVEPRALQPQVAYGTLPPNCDFEARNLSSSQPDTWTVVTAGGWGADAAAADGGFSGGSELRFATGSLAYAPTVRSQLFTVRPGDAWTFGIIWKQSTFGTAGTLTVKFLSTANPNATPVGTSLVQTLSDAVGEPVGVTWKTISVGKDVPGSARYAMVEVSRAAAYTGLLTIDALDAVRATSFWTQWKHLGDGTDPTHPFDNGWTNWDTTAYRPGSFRRNTAGRCQLRGMVKAPTPAPSGFSSMTTLPEEYWPTSAVFVRVPYQSGVTGIEITTSGAVLIEAVAAGTYLPLDGIEWDIT